jgi:hypothetical protein
LTLPQVRAATDALLGSAPSRNTHWAWGKGSVVEYRGISPAAVLPNVPASPPYDDDRTYPDAPCEVCLGRHSGPCPLGFEIHEVQEGVLS